VPPLEQAGPIAVVNPGPCARAFGLIEHHDREVVVVGQLQQCHHARHALIRGIRPTQHHTLERVIEIGQPRRQCTFSGIGIFRDNHTEPGRLERVVQHIALRGRRFNGENLLHGSMSLVQQPPATIARCCARHSIPHATQSRQNTDGRRQTRPNRLTHINPAQRNLPSPLFKAGSRPSPPGCNHPGPRGCQWRAVNR